MLVDLEVFYLGHLKNFYTIQYNTIHDLVYRKLPETDSGSFWQESGIPGHINYSI